MAITPVICQVKNQKNRVEFIWGSGVRFFLPYYIDGQRLDDLRTAAEASRTALEDLVLAWGRDPKSELAKKCSISLAMAGFDLFNSVLPRGDKSEEVRKWLNGQKNEPSPRELTELPAPPHLGIVVDEVSEETLEFLRIPWNLVYDLDPDDHFQQEHWKPFWSVRYVLTSGRRVEPLRSEPNWSHPRVLVVVDSDVYRELQQAEQAEASTNSLEKGGWLSSRP